MKDKKNPLLIIISGPSGVGKDAVIVRMKEMGLPFFFSVTATSRPRRPGEVEGVDYHFIDRDRFEEMIAKGEFLEWARVYGNLYGVPRKTVRQAMEEGKDAIVKVDIQGAATIKKLEPGAVSIFIAPPSMEELERRLRERKTETGTNLDLRLETAREEMKSRSSFDHVVVSEKDEIDAAISSIQDIINREKSRPESKAADRKASPVSLKPDEKKRFEKLTPERAGDDVLRVRRKHRYRIRLPRLIRRIRARLR